MLSSWESLFLCSVLLALFQKFLEEFPEIVALSAIVHAEGDVETFAAVAGDSFPGILRHEQYFTSRPIVLVKDDKA